MHEPESKYTLRVLPSGANWKTNGHAPAWPLVGLHVAAAFSVAAKVISFARLRENAAGAGGAFSTTQTAIATTTTTLAAIHELETG